MGINIVRKSPLKKLYLDGVLVSEYYGTIDARNYGVVEITETILTLDGKQYTGTTKISIDKNNTEIIAFTTQEDE